MHYVAQLNTDRGKLIEYKRFSKIKFEIQIRSILQHAWAEIEHDLGYKGLNTVTDSFKRNFSMIAALLEMANRDFVTLREESKGYKEKVGSFIKEAPQNVDINIDSLKAFIEKNDNVIRIDNLISKNAGAFYNNSFNLNKLDRYIIALNFFNIKTISDLENLLSKNEKLIIDFANHWIEGRLKEKTINAGISIFYLCYVLSANESDEKINNYLETIGITSRKAVDIKDTYNKINQN